MGPVTGTTAPPPQAPASQTIRQRIADELGVRPHQVAAAVDLLDGGATVPFIARYRKEATGTLDDAQLRTLEERLGYLRELEDRRAAVLEEIRKQGKLDPALEERIRAAESKARLEDIYLPFKPKRRTKAQVARENGLEPLADALLGDPTLDPQETAADYVTEQVARRRRGAGWRPRHPRRTLRRGRRPHRRPPRAHVEPRAARHEGPRGQGGRRREVRRLLRLLRAVHQAPLPPDPRGVPRGEGGSPRRHAGARRRPTRSPVPSPTGNARSRPPRASRDEGRAADRWLADCVRFAWRTRILMHLSVDIRVRLRTAAEERRHRRLREQPARPAARRPRRQPRHDGPRPRPAHRRQGRRGRRHRQDPRHRHDLPPRAAASLGRGARLADETRPRPQRRAHRDRQRHRLAGDREARPRAGRAQPGAGARAGRGERGRGVGLLGLGVRVGRAARA